MAENEKTISENMLPKAHRHWPWLLLAAGICVLIWGIGIEPDRLTIRQVSISHPALAKVLGGKKVIQLSDLHIKSIGKREQKLLRQLEEMKPDLLLLTGDYVRWNGDYQLALEFLSRLRARYGVYAVMGDYDYSRSRQSCRFCHEPGSGGLAREHPVRFLRDAVTVLPIDGKPLVLGGVDTDRDSSLSLLAEKLPEAGIEVPQDRAIQSNPGDMETSRLRGVPVLVLCHNPLRFAEIPPGLDWVVLAGDTHGGQIPLPGFLWKILGYGKNDRYNYGLFNSRGSQMFVSRGLGTSHVRFRFLAPPELVVIRFVE